MKKMLIVYFSWSCGNTQKIAERMAERTHADLLRLEPETPYPQDYQTVVEQGKKEVEKGYLPALRKLEKNPADYDVIAVGTPTWWYTMAPVVHSFLAAGNWKGKMVIPFMTNAGWPGHVIKDMEKACPGTEILLPKEIQFDSQGGSRQVTPPKEIDAWIRQIQEVLNA
jgi:flavodoxin